MSLLRKLHPELAEFLNPPKRPKKGDRFAREPYVLGQNATEHNKNQILTLAVWDASRIRAIWKKHYVKRPKGYPSPEELAAKRWRVDVEDVHTWKRSRMLPEDEFFNQLVASDGDF
jgi:hypothetical protein